MVTSFMIFCFTSLACEQRCCIHTRPALDGLIKCIALGLLLVTSIATNAETETEYQQRLQALAGTIKTIQNQLRSTKNDKNKLQSSLQESEQKQAALAKEIARIEEALRREKKQLARLRRQRAKLDKDKHEQQLSLDDTIRQAHRLGQQSGIKLLLNQQQPQHISRLVRYHRYIVNAHQIAVKDFIHTLDELTAVSEKINVVAHSLVQQQQDLESEQETLRSSQKKRLGVMRKISRSLRDQGQQLSTLNADQQRLQNLLDEATNTLANLTLPENTTPFNTLRGRLPFPTQGKILQAYGKPQFDGKLNRNGILIGNRMGADVVSVHYGRVIFSDYLRGHGLLIIIDHGDGYMSLYGHNEMLLKAVGEWVSASEKVATVGNSGGQTQIGLYFEIRNKGAPVNPQPWLQKS
jgi:septal ring factor EnvC (AmiA/AmiB activator)